MDHAWMNYKDTVARSVILKKLIQDAGPTPKIMDTFVSRLPLTHGWRYGGLPLTQV